MHWIALLALTCITWFISLHHFTLPPCTTLHCFALVCIARLHLPEHCNIPVPRHCLQWTVGRSQIHCNYWENNIVLLLLCSAIQCIALQFQFCIWNRIVLHSNIPFPSISRFIQAFPPYQSVAMEPTDCNFDHQLIVTARQWNFTLNVK